MGGADPEDLGHLNPKMCPNCGGSLQTSRKRVKCSCGHYVRPLEVGAAVASIAEQPDPLREKIDNWLAEVRRES